VFSSGRVDALQRFKLGRSLSVPQVAFDAAIFVWFLATVILIHLAGFSSGWSNLVQARTLWLQLSPEDTFLQASANLAVFATHAVAVFLFLKVVGARALSRVGVFFSGLAFVVALTVVPTFAVMLGDGLRSSGDPLFAQIAPACVVVGELSPAIAMIVNAHELPRWAQGGHWLVHYGFWLWHGSLILYLGWLVLIDHLSLAREAAALDGAADPTDPEAPACRRCRSRRSVPAGTTWWGGWLITRLAGIRRCVDCRQEYSPRTGSPSHRLMFLGSIVRFTVLMLLAFVVLWLLVGAFL
jgi:hypothetical protein